ncbi:HAD family hydrolase [Kordiimonas sp.]|uniref:HAD family hydrolase n=1 Tax=Kordiimonas sp. TaxID=1970157 RepID=UPI003A903EB1
MTARPWVFDCDGVLLNSNALKSNAMYQAASRYGQAEAEALLAYHKPRGGIGREIKFRYFFEHILNRQTDYQADYETLCADYSRNVRDALVQCDVAAGLEKLISRLDSAGVEAFVISGAEEGELRDILSMKKIDHLFKGIFGSPKSKTDNVHRLMRHSGIPDTFIGDSHHDCEVALHFGMQFYFLTDWTEMPTWQQDLPSHPDIRVLKNIRELDTLHAANVAGRTR